MRGKVQFAELGSENWISISELHAQASSRPKTLGDKKLTKSNPIQSIATWHSISRYLKAEKTNARHELTATIHHRKYTLPRPRSLGCLRRTFPPSTRTPKQLVNLYAKRMQIEETFRDLKSPVYGLGLRQSRTNSPERFDIILLIALMLQLMFWLAGLHAQKQGWDRHFQANTVRTRNVLSTVRLGMEVLRRSNYEITTLERLYAGAELTRQLHQYGYALGDL
ncbi:MULTISPECIES: IS4 family transposase [Vibrio]|uniref:IS4 family transposase n=1 Tax=Vibrio navarrensis TaxID=29495 RepID=A0AAJ4IEK5_9VIBR|nr:IS4 family transposase [Vibrio navarrensis]